MTKRVSVTTSSSDSLSGASETIANNEYFCAVETDQNFTASIISFAKLASDGVTWEPVNTKDGTGEYQTGTIQPSTYTPIDIQTFMACKELKVRSGISTTDVLQTSDTTYKLEVICL
jgi:hypothetical protein